MVIKLQLLVTVRPEIAHFHVIILVFVDSFDGTAEKGTNTEGETKASVKGHEDISQKKTAGDVKVEKEK